MNVAMYPECNLALLDELIEKLDQLRAKKQGNLFKIDTTGTFGKDFQSELRNFVDKRIRRQLGISLQAARWHEEDFKILQGAFQGPRQQRSASLPRHPSAWHHPQRGTLDLLD